VTARGTRARLTCCIAISTEPMNATAGQAEISAPSSPHPAPKAMFAPMPSHSMNRASRGASRPPGRGRCDRQEIGLGQRCGVPIRASSELVIYLPACLRVLFGLSPLDGFADVVAEEQRCRRPAG
jgi:hypothetical protein